MPGPILAAVDLSEASRRSLEQAVRLARLHRARLIVVHALQGLPRVPAYAMSLGATDEERDRIDREAAAATAQRLAQWVEPLRDQGIEFELVVEEAAAEDLILDTATEEGAAMIVLASHGWKGFKRFVLGSVAQSVLHGAKVPVLVVPAAAG